MKFESSDYEILTECPWCCSTAYEKWGERLRNFDTVQCQDCGLIYVKNRLNDNGLQKYYSGYLSRVRSVATQLNEQRKVIYEVEFHLIHKYAKTTNVLDVGCSGGYFLDLFHKQGYECFGVEFDEEAVNEAKKKYQVWCGKFDELEIDKRFDLIIFRGVIEHIPDPKTYLDKAVSLLNPEGYVYITSTPNADAFCCDLFKEMWNQHVPEAHLMHFNPRHFDTYFEAHGFSKIFQFCFYEETPYANVEEDILQVTKAIQLKRQGKPIEFSSPAFWGNMLSLIYQKR